MKNFDYERLDVYQAAIEIITLVEKLTQKRPKGKAHLADQLQRAASSVVLNISEGAGEFSANEKVRFYRMARRSATECASIIDIYKQLSLSSEQALAELRHLLLRVVSMLSKLARN